MFVSYRHFVGNADNGNHKHDILNFNFVSVFITANK